MSKIKIDYLKFTDFLAFIFELKQMRPKFETNRMKNYYNLNYINYYSWNSTKK